MSELCKLYELNLIPSRSILHCVTYVKTGACLYSIGNKHNVCKMMLKHCMCMQVPHVFISHHSVFTTPAWTTWDQHQECIYNPQDQTSLLFILSLCDFGVLWQ